MDVYFIIHFQIPVLVERVILRIGMAETDEQLEAALGKFLPPVLLKLNSQADGVRKKVCTAEMAKGAW